MATCPKCGSHAATGEFCDRCGSPLAAQAGDCPVRLEIDSLCFLIERGSGILRFRIGPAIQAQGFLSDVTLSLCFQGSGRQYSKNWQILAAMREYNVQIDAGIAGVHALDIILSFVLNGVAYSFDGNVSFFVARSEEVGKCAENIVFNIRNDIQCGHAADVRLSQDAADAIQDLSLRHSGESSFEELRRVVDGEARAYRLVPLELTSMPQAQCAAAQTAPAYSGDLTLEIAGTLIHLIPKEEITIGRHRDNTIVLQEKCQTTAEEHAASSRISRHHCIICGAGSSVILKDASSCGTFWNGTRISGEACILDAAHNSGVITPATGCESSFSLSVAYYSPMAAGLCPVCQVPSRDWCGTGIRPCVVIQQKNDYPEVFVALWSCFDFGVVIPALAGFIVARSDAGGFFWSTGNVGSGVLEPGMEFQSAAGLIRVTEYNPVYKKYKKNKQK